MINLKKYSDNQPKTLDDKEQITCYVCGPTVYNEVHIGNIRSILVMDVFSRAVKLTGKDFKLIKYSIKGATKHKNINLFVQYTNKSLNKLLDIINS